MKKLFTTNYSAGAFNTAMLLMRLIFGILLMNHGYGKLTHFNDVAQHMPSLFGMGGTVTAALVVFAEFFCSLFVILGLFTRLACIPVIICMGYALAVSHQWDVLGKGEAASLFLGGFLILMILGPGKVSVDGMIYDHHGQKLAQCTLRNVSVGGAQLELVQEIVVPPTFLLTLSQDGHVRRSCSKIWQFATVVGVRFSERAALAGQDSSGG